MIYNEIVSTLREIARDGLRMQLINAERQNSMRDNQELKATQDWLTEAKLDVASFEYEATLVADADPKKDSKLKEIEENKARSLNRIKQLEKDLETLAKRAENTSKFINSVSTGEVKVNAENLESETNRLIKVITEKLAVKINTDQPVA